MPWCPKCKSEYEEGIKVCADCKVDLVDDLDAALENGEEYSKLALLPIEEVDKVVEYLEYSNIVDIQVEKNETHGEIFVKKTEYYEAHKFFKIYVKEQFVNDDEENDIPEYETEEYSKNIKVEDYKSSAYSFTIVGGIVTVIAGLNLLDVVSLLAQDFYSIIFLVVGILLIGIGVQSFIKLKGYKEKASSQESVIQRITEDFKGKYPLDNYLVSKQIDKSAYDEGALYFVVIDVIKEELANDYPEESEKLINAVAEKVYGEIIEL